MAFAMTAPLPLQCDLTPKGDYFASYEGRHDRTDQDLVSRRD